MFNVILGAALVVAAGGFYYHLLPRDGRVNPLVKNSDAGSMITITIMSAIIVGVAIVCDGLFG
jgi:hypothetical protein